MTAHPQHKMHDNSLRTWRDLDVSLRETQILLAFERAAAPLTDRDVLRALGFEDPNMVRPRITELIKAGVLEECGRRKDRRSGRHVRLCRLAALWKPSDQLDLWSNTT